MKITILILAANPKNTSRLRLDEEIREIDIGLQMSRKRDDFILHKKMAVRPVDFRRAVLDIKPNILHFCGHGEGAGGLAFEDDMGHVKLVSAEAFQYGDPAFQSQLFRDRGEFRRQFRFR